MVGQALSPVPACIDGSSASAVSATLLRMSFSRREFLGTAAVAASLNAAESGMPARTLGRTGRKVSILVFGSGSRWLAYKEEDKAIAAMHRALDAGITYVDTAYAYGNGESESRVGKALQGGRRDKIFLATKIPDRKGDEAMRRIEGSLKRLQTDHVDLLHIHSLTDENDLAAIEAPDGVLKVLLKMRDEKVARNIGITCHSFPNVLATALERHDFDCTQMALNAGLVGMAKGPTPLERPASFETLALPVARKKKMGVIAMKVFAQEYLVGKATPEQLIRYPLSLDGVTAAVVGMPKLEYIDQNIRIAKAFKPLSDTEKRDLSGKLSVHKEAMDRYFCHHIDG